MARIRNQITYAIKADPSDFLTDMKKVNRSWDRTQANLREGARAGMAVGPGRRGIGDLVGAAGVRSLMSPVLGALGLAGGGMALMSQVRKGFNFAVEMDRFRQELNASYKDLRKTEKVLNEIYDLGNRTFVDTSQLVLAQKRFADAGINTEGALEAITAASQATGTGLKELTDVFARLALGDVGRATSLLGKMGISMKGLAGFGPQGVTDTSKALEALVDVLQGKFGPTLDAQSKTMKSTFDTLEVQVNRMLEPMGRLVGLIGKDLADAMLGTEQLQGAGMFGRIDETLPGDIRAWAKNISNLVRTGLIANWELATTPMRALKAFFWDWDPQKAAEEFFGMRGWGRFFDALEEIWKPAVEIPDRVKEIQSHYAKMASGAAGAAAPTVAAGKGLPWAPAGLTPYGAISAAATHQNARGWYQFQEQQADARSRGAAVAAPMERSGVSWYRDRISNITINAPVGVSMQSGLALGAGA